MPKQWRIYNDFSGGYNDAVHARRLKPNEVAGLESLVTDDPLGVLRTGGKVSDGASYASTDAATLTPGYGLFFYSADHDSAGNDDGQEWVACADAAQAQILLYESSWPAAAGGQIDLGTTHTGLKAVFDYADEVLRVSDAAFGAANQPKQYGFIQRDHFYTAAGVALTPGGAADAYDNWYQNDTLLSAPTRGIIGSALGGTPTASDTADDVASTNILLLCTTNNFPAELTTEINAAAAATEHYIAIDRTAAPYNVTAWASTKSLSTSTLGGVEWDNKDYAIYPKAGLGFNVDIDGSAGTGDWAAGTYEFAQTFIYDGNQESLPYLMSGTHTIVVDKQVEVRIYATSPYDERITGGRVYIRDSSEKGAWVMLADISLKEGVRSTMTGEYTGWVLDNYANSPHCYSATTSYAQNVETYEILNGFSAQEVAIDIGGVGEGWTTSLITGRRRVVANVKTRNKDGKTEQMRDVLMVSEPNRFDTFPRKNIITVVKGDAEEWVKIEEFGGRLLCFKQKTLYIIDNSSPSLANWRKVATRRYLGVGHPASVVRTDFGIVWANKRGLHLFDGRTITNLIDKKISYSVWEAWYDAETRMAVGYYPNRARLIIRADATKSNAPQKNAWIYNFRSGSWYLGTGALEDAGGSARTQTNFMTDADGELHVGYQAATIINFYAWVDTITATTTAYLKLGDDVLDNPGIDKEITAVTVTYKSSVLQTNAVQYIIDGGTSTVNLGNLAANAGWAIASFTPTPFTCQSIAIVIDPGTSGTVQISDITIEYRLIPASRAN